MKSTFLCLAVLASASAAYASDDFGSIDMKAIKAGKTSANVPAVSAPKENKSFFGLFGSAPTKEWTVMVFFNGKNNLESCAMTDMNEMESVGTTDKVNVVAELGRMNGQEGDDNSDGNWTGARRYLVSKDTDTAKINSKVVQTIAKADMGSWKHLVDFVQWSKKNYPARHYMLVIWNHGSGWESLGKTMTDQKQVKGISYDDQTGNHITTTEMGAAFAKIGKLDVYASDACLMQDAGVDYQIYRYSDAIVGSEEIVPGDGYDYNAFLTMLNARPSASAADVGAMVVQSFRTFYVAAGENTTISTIRSASMPDLAAKMDALAAAILANDDIETARNAADKAIKFYYTHQKDLGDFALLMANNSTKPAVKAAANALVASIKSAVASNGTTGKLARASGIAAYLPRDNSYDPSFKALALTTDGAPNWDKLATALPSPAKK